MKIKKTVSTVDEDASRCYTCHQELSAGSPAPALVVDVQLHEPSKLTIQVCLACYRRLDYDYTSAESHHQFYGCPILPESKIIVKTPNLSHKCFRCFEPLQDWSEHAVSLQDGILNASYPKVLKEVGYEFAVCLCNPCAHWKKFSGRMREVTTLKFPAFDPATRTLFLPPISTVHLDANSSKAGTKSINYPVSMLVNKAKSLLERFKDEASLSSPPSDITGSMLYIHTTKCKSSRSTHWSSDGFAFQKSCARVVRIQDSDHVIKETNWVTDGPGDIETKFKRRTITSSQMEDITLIHYLGEVGEGLRVSREIDLEDEDSNSLSKPQSVEQEGPHFFSNIFCYKLLTSELAGGKLRQDFKLMPLASKHLFWNGQKFDFTNHANPSVMTEAVRLVVDCKLSPQAVSEAFDGLTPELIRSHIRQLKSINIKNSDDSKYSSWLSFAGPWLLQKDGIKYKEKAVSSVVQYLRVPVNTNFKTQLSTFYADPMRLLKVLRNEDTGVPEDRKIHLIHKLAKDRIQQDKGTLQFKSLNSLFAKKSFSIFDNNPDPADPSGGGSVSTEVQSTSVSVTESARDDIILPAISSVKGGIQLPSKAAKCDKPEFIKNSKEELNYWRSGPDFFTHSSYFRLLTRKLGGKLWQDFKLMPLASKHIMWNGNKWCSSGDGEYHRTVMNEACRLVVDCKLSPEAVAEAFFGMTPQLIRTYIKQLHSLNIEDSKYESWLSFAGPWNVMEGNYKKGRKPFIQYLTVPVEADCEELLKSYINDPNRLGKVLKRLPSGVPQDKNVQLIQNLVTVMINKNQIRLITKTLGPQSSKCPSSDLNSTEDIPGVQSPTKTVSSASTPMPTILSVMDSVGGVPVMGSPAPPLPAIRKSPSQACLHKNVMKKVSIPVQPQEKKISKTGHHTQVPLLPTKPLPISGTLAPPATSSKPLTPKVTVSGNKIIIPPDFLYSGAQLVQIPTTDGTGTKRLVLINSKQSMSRPKTTLSQTTNVISSISSIPKSIIAQPQVSLVPSIARSVAEKKTGVDPMTKPTNAPAETITTNEVSRISCITESVISQPQVSLVPISTPSAFSISALASPKSMSEKEIAVDPLESPDNHQTISSQPRINHLERTSAVLCSISAEIAEECIFNKRFSDVLIYGPATPPGQKSPLKTHSLLLSAISPNFNQLLKIAERNGDGVYELVIPGVSLQEIDAFLEKVIETMLMPPTDYKSAIFTMSENLWTLFAEGQPDKDKLGKSYIHNKPAVPNSLGARLKPIESLTGHWAKQSVCDEQTGQMVIEMGRKRTMDSSDKQTGQVAIEMAKKRKMDSSDEQTGQVAIEMARKRKTDSNDEQTGQVVIEMDRKRKMDSNDEQTGQVVTEMDRKRKMDSKEEQTGQVVTEIDRKRKMVSNGEQ